MFFESWWLNISISIGLIVALTFDYVTKFFSYWYVRHIPYKSSFPFFGSDYHRVLGLRNTTQEVNTLYKQHPKEDFVGSVKCRIPDLIVRNPDLIKEVLSTEFEYFKSRGIDLDKSQDICLRNNLFYAEGEKWTVLREGLESLLNDVTFRKDCFLESLHGTNGNINVQQLLSKVLDVVFKSLLLEDRDCSVITELRTALLQHSLKDKLFSYIKNIFPSVYVLFGLPTLFGQPSKKSLKTLQDSKLCGKIESVFKNNRTLKSKPDVLSFGVISSFISEGYIPCMNVLAALIFELGKNSRIQEQVRKANTDEYLDAVIKETLRLYPPFSVITRKCVKAYKFSQSKVLIDRGVTVNIPVEAIHKDEAYFKEPHIFKPERFLDSAVQSYAFLPFGAGPRKCVGEQLSLQIIRSVAKIIIKNFEIEATEKTPTRLPISDFNFGRVIAADIWLKFKPIQ